ncbi:hypothetical protein ADUPG1_001435, partial [Aduncisulcus paluster]
MALKKEIEAASDGLDDDNKAPKKGKKEKGEKGKGKGKGKGKEQEEEEEEGEIILSLPSLPPSPPSPVSTLCINFPQGLSLSIPLSSLSSSPLIGTPSLSMIYVDLSISLSSPLASFISTETISILRACGCIRTDQFEMEQESKLLIDR